MLYSATAMPSLASATAISASVLASGSAKVVEMPAGGPGWVRFTGPKHRVTRPRPAMCALAGNRYEVASAWLPPRSRTACSRAIRRRRRRKSWSGKVTEPRGARLDFAIGCRLVGISRGCTPRVGVRLHRARGRCSCVRPSQESLMTHPPVAHAWPSHDARGLAGRRRYAPPEAQAERNIAPESTWAATPSHCAPKHASGVATPGHPGTTSRRAIARSYSTCDLALRVTS